MFHITIQTINNIFLHSFAHSIFDRFFFCQKLGLNQGKLNMTLLKYLTQLYSKYRGNPPPPPQFSLTQDKSGGVNTNPSKIGRKTACWEFAWTSTYTSWNRSDVSDIRSRNRGSKIRRWLNGSDRPINQDKGGKRGEGVVYGTGGSHHGTSTIGFSCRRHLLWMQAHINVQDRVMRVPQGHLRLRDLLMSGALCQRRTPDPTGRSEDNAVRKHRRDGYG